MCHCDSLGGDVALLGCPPDGAGVEVCAVEDYAHRPAIAALLDALTAYQAAQTAREAAGTALIAALEKELDR